jgi:arabinose-5-phosphate isomerase
VGCDDVAKSFHEKDFAALHPGVTLGTKLSVRVADVVIADEYTLLREDARMKDLISPLAEMCGTVPVVYEDRRITCVPTAGERTRLMECDAHFLDHVIGEIMTRDPKTALREELGSAAIHRMEAHGMMARPVEDEAGRFAGILHLHDLMRSGVV